MSAVEVAQQQEIEMKEVVEMPTGVKRKSSGDGSAKKKRKVLSPHEKLIKSIKKPHSKFYFFGQEERPKIKAENPEMPTKEVTKELSKRWNEVEDMSHWEYLVQKDILRFEEQMKAAKLTYEDFNMKKKKLVDPNMPKRPVNGYFLFASEQRGNIKQTHPNANIKEVRAMLADNWKKLSDDEKKKYNDKANEAREEYLKQKKEYMESDLRKKWEAEFSRPDAEEESNEGSTADDGSASDEDEENEENSE
jgi:hypothetical protein